MSGSPGSSLHVDLKIFISVTLLRLIVEGVVGVGGVVRSNCKFWEKNPQVHLI